MKNNLLITIFQFSPERFKNPFVISGLLIAFIGLIFLFILEKIIFKLTEKKYIIKYLDKENQEQIDNRVKDLKYKTKMIGKLIALVLVFLGCILCMQGVK